MNSACRKRRAEWAGKLLQRFSIHSLPRLVFQDEKGFSLQVPTRLFQWSQERCVTGTLVQWRKEIFEKGYGIRCDNLERKHWLTSKISWLQPFRLLLLGLRSRESIQLLSFRNYWWVEEKNSWSLGWVCNGSPPNPQSMKQFLSRLEAVDAEEGGSIKTVFG